MIRLRKEARALLPYWAGTLAAVAAPQLLGKNDAEVSWFFYGLGCALLGGMSFGRELQHRTLPMLLSQPASRTVLWLEKMLVLAGALLTSSALLAGLSRATGSPGFFDAVITVRGQEVRFLPWIPICVFCGAPLLTLLTNSALGGAILSLEALGVCLLLPMSSILLLVYCPLACALGWRQLQTWQARRPGSPASWLPMTSSSRGGPLVTLLRKELRLQNATFLLAIGLWVLFFVGGLVSDGGSGHASLIASAVTGLDLLILPLIAGAVALGEERTLGVADWQLSLPPPARVQWLAKMLVTLPTSLLLGLFLPLLVRRSLPDAQTLMVLVVAHLLLTHLALYAGSVSNGTMQAILLALGLWSLAAVAVLHGGLLERLGDPSKRTLAMVAMVLLLHAFAYSNYRERRLRPRRLGFQGLAVTGVLAFFAAIS